MDKIKIAASRLHMSGDDVDGLMQHGLTKGQLLKLGKPVDGRAPRVNTHRFNVEPDIKRLYDRRFLG